jgi:Rod binding domain-containing protein
MPNPSRAARSLPAPLKGADGEVYAIAQGNLIVAGAGASAGGSKVQVNHLSAGPHSGRCPGRTRGAHCAARGRPASPEPECLRLPDRPRVAQAINRSLAPAWRRHWMAAPCRSRPPPPPTNASTSLPKWKNCPWIVHHRRGQGHHQLPHRLHRAEPGRHAGPLRHCPWQLVDQHFVHTHHQPAQCLSTGGQTVVAEKANIDIKQEPGKLIQIARCRPAGRCGQRTQLAGRHAPGPAGHSASHQVRRRAECRAGGDLTWPTHIPFLHHYARHRWRPMPVAGMPSSARPAKTARRHQGNRQTVRVAVHARADQEHARSHHEVRHARQPGGDLGTDLLDQQFAVQMSGQPGGLSDAIAASSSAKQMGGKRPAGVTVPAKCPRTAWHQHPSAAAAAGQAWPGPHREPAPVCATASAVAREVERPAAYPASFMLGQAGHETGWGKHEIKAKRTAALAQPVWHQGRASWTGKVAEVTTTEYINGAPQKRVAKFRAYDSYADSFQGLCALINRARATPRRASKPARPRPLPAACKKRATPPTPTTPPNSAAPSTPRKRFTRPGLKEYTMGHPQHRYPGAASQPACPANRWQQHRQRQYPGYSRQKVILETVQGQYTGGGYIGQGCRIADHPAQLQ